MKKTRITLGLLIVTAATVVGVRLWASRSLPGGTKYNPNKIPTVVSDQIKCALKYIEETYGTGGARET